MTSSRILFLTETDLTDISGYDVIRQVKQRINTDCIIRTTGQRRHTYDGVTTNVSGYLYATLSGTAGWVAGNPFLEARVSGRAGVMVFVR